MDIHKIDPWKSCDVSSVGVTDVGLVSVVIVAVAEQTGCTRW
jgi:hypothetical protein